MFKEEVGENRGYCSQIRAWPLLEGWDMAFGVPEWLSGAQYSQSLVPLFSDSGQEVAGDSQGSRVIEVSVPGREHGRGRVGRA